MSEVKEATANRTGLSREAASRNLAAGRSLNRSLGYPYGYGRYGYSPYRYYPGYYGGSSWDSDDWWGLVAYGAAARLLGASFGNSFYGAYPFYPSYGLGGYGGGFGFPSYGGFGSFPYGGLGGYGGYGYYPRFGLGAGLGGATQPYYFGGTDISAAPAAGAAPAGAAPAGAVPARNVATLDVIVPDPDARVWVQGRETSSRGAQRVYHSPPLERGYHYRYTVRATWRENGRTMSAQRSVPVRPGRRVNVDFTQGIAELVAE